MKIDIYLIKILLLLLLTVFALVSDLKTYRIGNRIVLPPIILGIVINIYEKHTIGLIESMKGIFIPIILLILLFALGMLGAGDIKLFSGIGAIMGGEFIILCIPLSFLIGGIACLTIMMVRKNAKERFNILYNYIKSCLIIGKLLPYEDIISSKDARFPLATAIFAASLVTLVTTIYMK